MIPFLTPDLPPWEVVRDELEQTYKEGRFHPGPFVERFERAVEAKLGVRHAIMVSTASDGLILLAAFAKETFSLCKHENRSYTIGPDFTFRATPQAAWWAGLDYIPTDVGMDGNLSPEALDKCVRAGRGNLPAVVFGVHCFGQPCQADEIRHVAGQGTMIFYDAAHALGARYRSGAYVGGAGTAECFSLNITKAVPSCGEGGVITTNDDQLAQWLVKARWHGDKVGSLDWVTPGMNAKPTEWQAIVAFHAFQRMDEVIAARNHIAGYYRVNLPRDFTPLQQPTPHLHGYKDYAVLASTTEVRVQACQRLEAVGIGYKRYFSPLVSQMRSQERHWETGQRAMDIANRIICLPMSTRVTPEHQDVILSALAAG